jgi:hypothetical protein
VIQKRTSPGRRLDRLEGQAARRGREADRRVLHRRLAEANPPRTSSRTSRRSARRSWATRRRDRRVAAPQGSSKYKIPEIKAA